jgi:membrane protein YfhO
VYAAPEVRSAEVSLLALRLVAVYFGSAAVVLWLAHRFVRRLSAAVAIFAALAPLLLTGKALVTGGLYAPIDIVYQGEPFAAHRAEAGIEKTQTPLLSDVVYQGIPWRKAVREAAKSGRWPLWNRFIMAGTPLLAAQLSSVFHPGTWVGFLLPLPQAWTFDMAFRFLVSLVCALLFFRELELGNLPSLIGASGWAFSDFLVFLSGHPQSPAIGPFPLLLLGLRRLARDPGRGAAAVTAAALLPMVAAGHPESLLHTVAGAGIYFVAELLVAGRGRRGRAILVSLATGALVLGLSAASLLPFLEILPRTQELLDRTESASGEPAPAALRTSVAHSLTFLLPYAYGVSGQGRVRSYLARPAGGYAGALLIALAAIGALARRRERWIFLLYVFLGLAVFVSLTPVAGIVSGLPLFSISLNHRLVFLAAFGVSALAALGAEELRQGRAGPRFVFACLGVSALLLLFFGLRFHPLLDLEMPREFLAGRILLQVVPLLAGAFFVPWALRRRKRGLAVGGVLVLFLGARALEARTVHPTYPARAFYPRLPMLEAIPRGDPYRVVGIGYELVPGASAIYELEDVRGYEMTTLASLVETFPLWCVRQPVWFNRVDDPTKPFLAFLNVRYVISPPAWPVPPGWRVLAREPGGWLLENPNALPRAFAPRRIYREGDPARQRQRLLSIADFGQAGVVESASVSQEENGEAKVDITGYTGQSLEVSVDAGKGALVATSVTAWPGWRLSLDGKESPLLRYNRAFLAFEAPPGHHRAVLRYWPRSFTWGLTISSVSLLAAMVALATPRRRRSASTRGRGAA